MILAYQDICSQHSNTIDLATCDAETSGDFELEESIKLLMGFLMLISPLKPGTQVIFKTFCRVPSNLYEQLKLIAEVGSNIHFILPPFSSHESYEIFITFTLVDESRRGTHSFIDRSHYDQIKMMAHSRIGDKPFLLGHNKRQLTDLFNSLHTYKFPLNIYSALKSILGDLITYQELQQGFLYSFSCAEERAYYMILNRMGLSEKYSSIKKVSRKEVISLFKRGKDSKEIGFLSRVIFNSILLKQLFIYGYIDYKIWNNSLDIKYNDIILYTFNISYSTWIGLYGRSYHKLVGYLYLLDILKSK